MILAIDQGTTGTTCLVLRRGRRAGRARVPRVRPALPAARAGSSTTPPRSATSRSRSPPRRSRTRAPGTSTRSASPTSARPSSSGTRDRRAAAPRARLAGPPHARALRRAASAAGFESLTRERTGLVLDPYFSGTKIEWLLQQRRRAAPSAPATAARCSARSTPGSIFCLTGELATDETNASRTLLYDIHAGRWDPELLELFGVPERALPEVRPSIGDVRRARATACCPASTACRSRGVAGDQQAALYGQACLDPGEGKNTYGTGSFALLNSGDEAPQPPRGPADDDRVQRSGSADLRARGGDLRHRRRGAVAARRPGDHRGRRPRPRSSRGRSTRPTASCSSRR